MSQEKKLSDYQKEHIMIAQEVFDDLSYMERLQLYHDFPEEYRRLTGKDRITKPRPTGFRCSSQVKR